MIYNGSFYPALSFVRHHDDLLTIACVPVLSPRRLPVRKFDPKLSVSGRDILESLRRVPELERLEKKVLVHPVMRLLVERATGKWITDIEDVAVDLLIGMC